MRKKILFVQAWLGREQRFYPFPIGLAAVAARLVGAHDVKGFDPNVAADPMGELARLVAEFKPDIVGLSLRNIDSTNYFDPYLFFPPFAETVRTVRRQAPGATLVAGGSGYSLFPEEIMRRLPEIDLGLYLEGDIRLEQLLDHLDDPAAVPGIYYRRDGVPVFSGASGHDPFCDDWPFPAWDIFDLEPYKRIPYSMGVETKRGCAYRCVYCCYYILNGRRYRLKSPDRVVAEIKELAKRGFKDIHFTDSVFNVPTPHAMAILGRMREEVPGMRWNAYLSPEGITDEFVELALSMGLSVFGCSPDTYGDAALAAMGKNMGVADIERAVEVIRRHPPAEFGANFFVNGPTYTYGTLFAILRFGLWAKLRLGRQYSLLRLIKANYIRIEPGTRIEAVAREEGVIGPDTEMLPETLDDFRKTFYINRHLRAFNAVYMPLKDLVRRLHVLLFRRGKSV
ncbi:Radical SAM domain protein [Solidesulfovibrio carbinoliphilus subsp. oakridgensis]|uniref:Radical SAM domain protein n=1 Tax=Solidesulfovibrio carbinoliphilus subsp. oakridgensis TaxID=694327 RepID=G7Q6H4_9BACT|nr:B12-binding domain-containing radical SAM protein [Solidesulfovibrio carbinoliphilus]EHJ47587.1 Radical SAM domain protein [Solidesulfovibrio carbinoliphilus subsp. oakridgensis]